MNTQAIQELVKGTTIVSAQIETEPKMNKRGNPFHGYVLKSQKLNGVVGYDYESSVNRLASKEGKEERKAKSRTWGVLSKDRVFVHHKGEDYLRMKVEKSSGVVYLDKRNGEEIDVEVLRPYFPSRKKSSTQSDLVGEVIERDVKMTNVKSLKIRGLTIS